MRKLSEMVLVIVAALVFLSAAFTIRPAFPLASFSVPSLPSHDATLRSGRSPPIGPAEPVLAPVPDPAPPASVPASDPIPIPPLPEAKFFRL